MKVTKTKGSEKTKAAVTFDSSSYKQQSTTDQSKRKGGGLKRIKLRKLKNYIQVLPALAKRSFFKRVMVHQIWKNKTPVLTAACGRAVEGGDCCVCQFGFKLRDQHKESKSEKKQNLFRNFMSTNDPYVAALDLLDKEDLTPGILKLPNDAFELLLNEVDEASDVKTIFDLDEGRPLFIKGNGKDGNQRRYVLSKFKEEPSKLVEQGLIDADEIYAAIPDLEKLQPKQNEEKLKEVLRKLKKLVLAGEEDAEDEDEPEADETDADEVDADDDEDEDSGKGKKKPAGKKKPSKDEDEDDDDDGDDDEDSDGDDDEDADDEDSDDDDVEADEDDDDGDDVEDDDDEDSDDEDADDEDDDDEDEKPASKKKPAGKTKLKGKK